MTTTVFDAAKYLDTEDDILGFLEAAIEDGNPQHIANCLGVVARSKGMTEMAKRTGVKRQALYQALSHEGNPTLSTLTAVLDALGLQLRFDRKAA